MFKLEKLPKVQNIEMEIMDSAHAFVDSTWSMKNVCDPFTRMYFILDGEGYIECSGKITYMEAGKVYIIPSGCNFSSGCTNMEKLYFHVCIFSIEKYDLLSGLGGIYSLDISEEDACMLIKLQNSEVYFDLLELKSELLRYIIEFIRLSDCKLLTVRNYSPLVQDTILFIQNNISSDLNAKTIAKEMFVSESKLRNNFKKELGFTIGKYIDDLVFSKAKKMLMKKELSIKNISDELGFCDQFYFARRFKQKYKKTPSQYRKEIYT